MQNKVYQIITDRIIAQLETGVVPWHRTWSDIGAAHNLISHKPYRGFNAMLLGMAPFKSAHWLTHKQCTALGGHVNKGQKGWPVIFWKFSYKLPNGSYSEGTTLTPSQRKLYEKFCVLRYYTVFNSEQCEVISQHVPSPIKRSVNQIEGCENIIKNYINCPTIVHGGHQPYYSPSLDYVRMPEQSAFISPEAYYATLFHELTHSTGHAKRLNREGITSHKANFGSCEYSKEELIAELGNCFLINHAGILSDSLFENSASYIQSWIKVLQNNPQMIIQASSKAQQAVDYILNIEAATLDVAA